MSKQLWVNFIALVALAVQLKYGFMIDPNYQIALLAFVNMVLRGVTHEKLYFWPDSSAS